MKTKHNYYEILHVQPDAPTEIIRSSYRTMMQRLRMHPDLGGDSEHAAVLNEAYATLMEPANRAAYDESRQRKDSPRQQQAESAASSPASETAPAEHCLFCNAPCRGITEVQEAALCSRCDSPLRLTQQHSDEDQDRRSILRVAKEHSVVFCTNWPQREPHFGRTDDISLTGMKFRSTSGLEHGQIIKLDSEILRAVAQVTRVQWLGSFWEVGVKFLTLSFEQSRGSFVHDRV